MNGINVRISACPNCGAPIYGRRLNEDFFKGHNEKLFLSSEIYECDDNGLPKNFFTCSCGSPKLLTPTVDIDKVHEKEFEKQASRLDATSVQWKKEKELREAVRKSGGISSYFETVLAMERLQELTKLGYGVRIREKKEGEKRVAEYAKWSYELGLYEQRKLQYGDSIAEAILNIKINKGESHD